MLAEILSTEIRCKVGAATTYHNLYFVQIRSQNSCTLFPLKGIYISRCVQKINYEIKGKTHEDGIHL